MCFWVDDESSFSRVVVRRARKERECCECVDGIKPRDYYRLASYVFDGRWYQLAQCARCHFIAAAIASVERSEGCAEYEAWPAWGELEQAWDDDPKYAVALGVGVPIEEGDPEGGLTAPRLSELPRW